MTIAPAVAHAVKTGDTVDIEGVFWMPEKAATIKTALRLKRHFPMVDRL